MIARSLRPVDRVPNHAVLQVRSFRSLRAPSAADLDPLSFFKTLVDHEVTVELKNDIQIRGTLKSVDQFLNIKLENIEVVEELKYPHLVRSNQRLLRQTLPPSSAFPASIVATFPLLLPPCDAQYHLLLLFSYFILQPCMIESQSPD